MILLWSSSSVFYPLYQYSHILIFSIFSLWWGDKSICHALIKILWLGVPFLDAWVFKGWVDWENRTCKQFRAFSKNKNRKRIQKMKILVTWLKNKEIYWTIVLLRWSSTYIRDHFRRWIKTKGVNNYDRIKKKLYHFEGSPSLEKFKNQNIEQSKH